MFGLGEKAGLNIEGEQPGLIADAPPSDGLGMMTSFGEGFSMTPLELTAHRFRGRQRRNAVLSSASHARKQEIDQFVPQVKRQLNIAQWLTDIKPGMMGAVEYGTARRAGFSATEPIFGKTGTCTDNRSPTHLGWFGSYNEIGGRKLVVVVLLTGGHSVSGPIASGVAGAVYKNLSRSRTISRKRDPQISPARSDFDHRLRPADATPPSQSPQLRNTRAVPRIARRAATAPDLPAILRAPAVQVRSCGTNTA